MKYRITLSQTVTETAVVEIEADDQEHAELQALVMGEAGTLEFKFAEVEQDMEVIHSEEWPPVNEPDPPDPMPEGVIAVSLEDPAELHNTLKRIFGE